MTEIQLIKQYLEDGGSQKDLTRIPELEEEAVDLTDELREREEHEEQENSEQLELVELERTINFNY